MRTWMVSVPVVLALGMASGWLSGSGNGNAWFAGLTKPWFMPPGWVFPVAWTLLYIAMGVAVALVWDARGPWRDAALVLFAVQLALNLAWSPLFFAGHRADLGLVVIGLLDLAVIATFATFAAVSAPAAALLVPYAAWLALATALNAAILRLN